MCHVLIPSLFGLVQPVLDLNNEKKEKIFISILKKKNPINSLVFPNQGKRADWSPHLPKNWVEPRGRKYYPCAYILFASSRKTCI